MDFRPAVVESVDRCGTDVLAMTLRRPDGYSFRAGQWFQMRLQTPGGVETRTFSHAAAPSDPVLTMATRLSDSAFKKALGGLAPGDTVEISPPGGRLTLPDTASLVMLVGGVGITPVRSLLREKVFKGEALDEVTLLYGNRGEECIPFRDDIESMREQGLSLVHVLESAGGPADAEHGFINAETVQRHVKSVTESTFVVTGPPPMVTAMLNLLDQLDIAADKRVIESFGAL